MYTVKGIIDMDGFTVAKKFYCKELAMMKQDDTYATSILFDLGLSWNQLNKKDQISARYLEKHIHQIDFNAPSTIHVSNLPKIVKSYFNEPNTLVGYKGGQFERNLLVELGIPFINLEYFGCPKAKQLFRKLGWLETCGQHLIPDAYHHCSKVEVEAFAMWLW